MRLPRRGPRLRPSASAFSAGQDCASSTRSTLPRAVDNFDKWTLLGGPRRTLSEHRWAFVEWCLDAISSDAGFEKLPLIIPARATVAAAVGRGLRCLSDRIGKRYRSARPDRRPAVLEMGLSTSGLSDALVDLMKAAHASSVRSGTGDFLLRPVSNIDVEIGLLDLVPPETWNQEGFIGQALLSWLWPSSGRTSARLAASWADESEDTDTLAAAVGSKLALDDDVRYWRDRGRQGGPRIVHD